MGTDEVDVLADAGEVLKRFKEGIQLSEIDEADDVVIVFSSAILAVAAEIRNVHNVLVDLVNKES